MNESFNIPVKDLAIELYRRLQAMMYPMDVPNSADCYVAVIHGLVVDISDQQQNPHVHWMDALNKLVPGIKDDVRIFNRIYPDVVDPIDHKLREIIFCHVRPKRDLWTIRIFPSVGVLNMRYLGAKDAELSDTHSTKLADEDLLTDGERVAALEQLINTQARKVVTRYNRLCRLGFDATEFIGGVTKERLRVNTPKVTGYFLDKFKDTVKPHAIDDRLVVCFAGYEKIKKKSDKVELPQIIGPLAVPAYGYKIDKIAIEDFIAKHDNVTMVELQLSDDRVKL